ncbi:MAG: hypothetical protein LC637_04015 [Xanthomonadaceae bacterium]|nr:hypothetical protein [Xanthomonadaceae bacterium]
MITINACAPGKMMLIGEYAVLHGSPALVMAVNRRARVRIEPSSTGSGWLQARPLDIQRRVMAWQDDAWMPLGNGSGMLGLTGRFIAGLLDALGLERAIMDRAGLTIDSTELFDTAANGQTLKLGLGSSAAVSAALALALGQWCAARGNTHTVGDSPGRFETSRLTQWLPVYRHALRSNASGADLAAALHGGVIEYRIDQTASDSAPVVRAMNLPVDLHWRAIWTGRPAQTTDFVAAFEAYCLGNPAAAGPVLARMDRIARAAIGSLDPAQADTAESLINAMAEYAVEVQSLGTAMGLEIVTESHRRLSRRAADWGLVYKSCGAGGGDLGMLLGTDPDRIEAFARSLSDDGGHGVPLDLSVERAGAQSARVACTPGVEIDSVE